MNDWRALAVCRGLPPRLFYDDGISGRSTTRRAITICHTCPVMMQCRYEALAIHATKTHCPKGHEYNRTVTRRGTTERRCGTCENARNMAAYYRRKEGGK